MTRAVIVLAILALPAEGAATLKGLLSATKSAAPPPSGRANPCDQKEVGHKGPTRSYNLEQSD